MSQKDTISAAKGKGGNGRFHKKQVQILSWTLIVNGEGNSGNQNPTEINNKTENVPFHSVNSEGNTISNPKLFKIDLSDIEDEIRYWEITVACFVVGANPLLHVIDGFARLIWKDLDIDTIGMVDKGVFMVRMKSSDSRDKSI